MLSLEQRLKLNEEKFQNLFTVNMSIQDEFKRVGDTHSSVLHEDVLGI